MSCFHITLAVYSPPYGLPELLGGGWHGLAYRHQLALGQHKFSGVVPLSGCLVSPLVQGCKDKRSVTPKLCTQSRIAAGVDFCGGMLMKALQA